MLYRKKIEIVEAIQWDETAKTFNKIKNLDKSKPNRFRWLKNNGKYSLKYYRFEDNSYSCKGDWIIKFAERGIGFYSDSVFKYMFEPHHKVKQ